MVTLFHILPFCNKVKHLLIFIIFLYFRKQFVQKGEKNDFRENAKTLIFVSTQVCIPPWIFASGIQSSETAQYRI
jgi:hypothetical protein